jgi:glutamate N-acetyltransferase/amino-acid N-acetyltransferase
VINTDADRKEFQGILDVVLMSLGKQLVKDGEGATKLVEIAVMGANSDADAYQIADTVAHSNLLKTALFGEDANWGRILGAVGRAGVPIQCRCVDGKKQHGLRQRGRGPGHSGSQTARIYHND